MLRIAICDDNADELRTATALLEEYLQTKPAVTAHIVPFCSAQDVLNAASPFDLYLLDVLMPGMTGIELGLQLRQRGDAGLIVYLTNSAEFAVESYQARAFHYLLKPLQKDSLFPILDMALPHFRQRSNAHIVVKNHESVLRLPLHQIVYAELYNRAVRYHLTDEQVVDSVSLRGAFQTATAPLLAEPEFVRCGASFVLNLEHVSAVKKDGAVLKNGHYLQLPKKACGLLRAAWLDYWLAEESKL
ncbi:MAG: response regulator transcription factor [Faecalibacterium sp.]|nr:response regulator transcription factor [Faecalibacterium sp.]